MVATVGLSSSLVDYSRPTRICVFKNFPGVIPRPPIFGVGEGRAKKGGAKERDGTGEVGKDWPAQLLEPSAAYAILN
jgi:hypothetical protein